MSNIVSKARDLAKMYHFGQTREDGKDYFDHHVCGVVKILEEQGASDLVLAAGYLHDTLEDTYIQMGEIAEIDPALAHIVHWLTRPKDKTYYDYIMFIAARIGAYKGAAVQVKLADLQQNMSDCSEKDKYKCRWNKYALAREILLEIYQAGQY
jgi:(p)ppGpp synthase/HD superfamily hydrolase